MYKDKALITYYTLTPLHMGAGSSVSYVDLPIQRERHTSFPMMAASGIKGVFRSFAERKWNDKEKVNLIFGPEDSGSEYSSCIAFTDARILLYPVRSVKNIFAWITCPLVLRRFKEDLKSAGIKCDKIIIPELSDDQKIVVPSSTKLTIDNVKSVGLEEFVFEIQKETEESKNDKLTEGIINYIQNHLPNVETKASLHERFAIVSDNVFTDLVNYAVEVRTRIKIDQTTGTAQSGALFTVEMVPSEAIFYSLLFATEPTQKKQDSSTQENCNKNVIQVIKDLFTNDEVTKDEVVLQFGGDETIGVGFTKMRINLESGNDNKSQEIK